MQTELPALWMEQCDQTKKKKEQCATEASQRQFIPSSAKVVMYFIIIYYLFGMENNKAMYNYEVEKDASFFSILAIIHYFLLVHNTQS